MLNDSPKKLISIFDEPKSIDKYKITSTSIHTKIMVDQIDDCIFLCLAFLKISETKPLIKPNAIQPIKYP